MRKTSEVRCHFVASDTRHLANNPRVLLPTANFNHHQDSGAGPILEHSCFHSLPPLFTILCSYPSCVQADINRTQILLDGARPCLSETAGETLQVTWQSRDD